MADLLPAASPVLVLAVLILLFRFGVVEAGAAGLLYTAVLVHAAFGTPLRVIALAAADGVVTTLPVILVVYAGILLADVLLAAGALKRMGDLLAGRAGGKAGKALALSFGLGNVLEGAGIVAEPLSAPLFRAEDFPPDESAALAILGYSGLLTLEFAGIILTVLSLATGIGIPALVPPAAALSVAAMALTVLALPAIVRSHPWTRGDLLLLAGAVAVLGLTVVVTARHLSAALSGIAGGAALLLFVGAAGRVASPGAGRGAPKADPASLRDILPYAVIVVPFLLATLVPPLEAALTRAATVRVAVVPNHPVAFRPLVDIYTWLFLAGIAAEAGRGGGFRSFAGLVVRNLPRGGRAAVAMALFGAMGQVIAYSGFDAAFAAADPGRSIAAVIAQGLHALTGKAYLVFVPLLGWSGTFLTGYGVASIMLFGALQVSLGPLLGVDPALLAAALAVGAGVGSISSPFKVAIAAPLCGAAGREPDVLRRTIPAGIAICLALGAGLYLYAARFG